MNTCLSEVCQLVATLAEMCDDTLAVCFVATDSTHSNDVLKNRWVVYIYTQKTHSRSKATKSSRLGAVSSSSSAV